MNRFDSIQYMNVYSQKREFLYTDIEKEFREFITICRGNGLKLSGRIFYSIEHISKEGRVVAEFFYPSAHLKKVRNTMLDFQTYFMIDSMISIVVENNFEANMEKAYAALLEIASAKGKQIISPIYNEICADGKSLYFIVKAAVG